MRGIVKALIVFGLLVLLSGVAAGQAMVEHALTVGGGSVAGAAGKSVGSGIDSIFRKVNKVTDQAARPATPAPARKPALQPEPTLATLVPSPTLAEIAQIQTGASRQDVLAKLGTPSARITIPDGDGLVEIYQYAAKGERLGSLRLTDGVVSAMRVEAR
jgi:Flp pilus assembly pilin Flp